MACGIQQFRKVALRGWFRAQVMNRGTALRNAFLRCKNCLIQDLHRIVRIAEQQFTSRLKLKNRSLKALQQGVMQLARNPRALADARLQSTGELPMHLVKTQLVKPPQQCQKSDHAET